jgi:hypothetical protein
MALFARIRESRQQSDRGALEANCSWLPVRPAPGARRTCQSRGSFSAERALGDEPRGSTPARILLRRSSVDGGGREPKPAGVTAARRVAVALDDSWRQAPGTRPRRLGEESADAGGRAQKAFALVHTNAPIEVRSNTSRPCGQDSQPTARMPPTARRAPHGERRASLVAGPVRLLALPHRPGTDGRAPTSLRWAEARLRAAEAQERRARTAGGGAPGAN